VDEGVSISVSDDGGGVPPGEEERIFDRHVSLHGGTGIGLAVARALVERDGGRLRLATARPPRFEILLPAP
jgi:signal transduction histidine kinase